jgi:ribonuclease HI
VGDYSDLRADAGGQDKYQGRFEPRIASASYREHTMKTYLSMPFKDKDRAKSLGARFDMARKQWFVPDGVDLSAFKEWLPLEVGSPAKAHPVARSLTQQGALKPVPHHARWKLWFDGSASQGGNGRLGCGYVVECPDGSRHRQAFAISQGTSNEAEYHACLRGLEYLASAINSGGAHVTVYGDSKLVVNQCFGRWKVQADNLRPLRAEVRKVTADLARRNVIVSGQWIRRDNNAEADALARTAHALPVSDAQDMHRLPPQPAVLLKSPAEEAKSALSGETRPKRDYSAQKDYYASLKQQGVVRHAIIVEGKVRDAFVARAKEIKCTQGDLLAALLKLDAARAGQVADLIDPRQTSAEREKLKTRRKQMRETIKNMALEELEMLLAKLHEEATS